MIKIGIIGTGSMAHHHAKQYQKIDDVVLTACCDSSEDTVTTFAEQWQIPNVYTDYAELLRSGTVDGISNVTPDALHAEIAIEAIRQGVAVLGEKPMATTLEEARAMFKVVQKQPAVNMINFSKRNASGLQAAKACIEQGQIGRILHVEASYLQDWLTDDSWKTTPAFLWRLSTQHGSTGVLGDLGCHIYDMASFLCGDILEIDCRLKTFDKGVEQIGEYVLDANDSFVTHVVFRNGALGTIHSTRWARGFKNREYICVHGDRGSLEIDFERGLETYRIRTESLPEWKDVTCAPTLTNEGRFVQAIRSGTNDSSDFENGLKIQAYLHYSVMSDREKRTIPIQL